MRRLLHATFLSLAIAILVGACDGDDDGTTSGATDGGASPTPTTPATTATVTGTATSSARSVATAPTATATAIHLPIPDSGALDLDASPPVDASTGALAADGGDASATDGSTLACSTVDPTARSFALVSTLASLPAVTLDDLGWVTSSASSTLLPVSLGIVTADGIEASAAIGASIHASGDVATLRLTIGAVTIDATLLVGSADASCDGADALATASSSIGTLALNGASLPLSGAPNQTIPIPIVNGKIVANERVSIASTGTAHALANALHVVIPGVADVAIGHGEARISCACAEVAVDAGAFAPPAPPLWGTCAVDADCPGGTRCDDGACTFLE